MVTSTLAAAQGAVGWTGRAADAVGGRAWRGRVRAAPRRLRAARRRVAADRDAARAARAADAARRRPRRRAARRGRRRRGGRPRAPPRRRSRTRRTPPRAAAPPVAGGGVLRAGALRIELAALQLAHVAAPPPLGPGWRAALAAALDAAPPAPRELATGSHRAATGRLRDRRRRARRPRRRADARGRRRAGRVRGLAARGRPTDRAGPARRARSRPRVAGEWRETHRIGAQPATERQRATALDLPFRRRALLAARAGLPALCRAGRAARARRCCPAGDPRRRSRRRAAPGRRAVALGVELRRCHALGHRRRSMLVNEIGPNFIARPYRGVSVQDVESLEPAALLRHIRSRRVYRRTEFIVAVCGEQRALVQLERADGDEILVGVRDARVLAAPEDVAFVVDPAVDTGNASQLARVSDPDALVTVVEGRFQHVNFIFAPAPLRIRVVEVVPPHPPKLLDMARTVLAYDEDLPPLAFDLVRDRPARDGPRPPGRPLPVPVPLCGPRARRAGRLPRRRTARRRRLDAARLRALAADPRRALRARAARAGRLLPAAGRGRARAGARPCSSAACASAGSSGRARG